MLLTAWPTAANEPISINRDDTALDLTRAVEIYRDRGPTFRVSTAPDAEGIVRTIEVQATSEETAGNWAVLVLTNNTDLQIDRLLVAPRFRLVNSGVFWPDLGSQRIASITPSAGFSLDRVADPDADIFAITLDPGAIITLVAELASPSLPQLYLWEEDAYREIVNSYTLYNGIVLGICGLLALFLSILFVVRGTTTFPAAALLAWSVLAYILIDFGFVSQFSTMDSAAIGRWRAIAEVAIVASLGLFLFSHLRLDRWSDRLRWTAFVWLLSVLALGALVTIDPSIAAGIARVGLALTAAFGLLLIIVLSLRGFDKAIMLIPAWVLLVAWIFAGWMTVTGAVDNDIIQPALAGGLVLIVLLIGFTIMQSAFAGGALQENLFSNVELQALAVKGSGGIVWDWDVGRDRLTTTPNLGLQLGLPANALQGPVRNWLKIVHPDDRDQFRAALDAAVEQRRGKIDLTLRLRTGETQHAWYNVRARPVTGADGSVIRCIGTANDVSSQKRAEERLLHDAVHDNLTGLPNRELFFDRIKSAAALAAAGQGVKPTVFIVDLDRFKEVNESVGMNAADTLLITVARRLKRLLRPQDTLARIGGDQFGIVLVSESAPELIANFAEQVKKTIKAPVSFAEREIVLTPSVGLATWTADCRRGEELFKDTELALHQAKRFGGDRVEPFRPAFRDGSTNLLQIESDLHRAISRSEIYLVYQPIIRAADNSVAGFEALMRWRHPRRGEIPPSEFIAVAERSGLIAELGAHGLEIAAAQLMDWDTVIRDTPVFISVNVSSQQLVRRDFTSQVAGILARYPNRRHSLRLEITETSLMENPEQNVRILERIRDLGVKLAIDDFGTGYSSLSYLARFPFDVLKIDQSFVQPDGAHREALLNSIVEMAHALDLSVVAEGVENEEDAKMLVEMGADYLQGFVTGQPVSADEAAAMVAEQNPIVADDEQAAE
ncbi:MULTISPECIES: EAL domain-containing protein [unclassified Roseitalea]|uniref:EAL domain-containing protein n=1 Tax=unclassified Roseitalea TaxID=2639107 RepID=UPI00273F8C05|nr:MULTISPECIES: EAL domain-containing protein [unclassified Roseitalea]